MINFNTLSLNNRVLVDNRITGSEDLEECTVVGLTENLVEVKHEKTGIVYKCKKDQVEHILLSLPVVVSLGFTERKMKDSAGNLIDDWTLCKEINSDLWYLLSIKKINDFNFFLEIKENGTTTVGSGFAKSLHQLQNLVKFITDQRCEI